VNWSLRPEGSQAKPAPGFAHPEQEGQLLKGRKRFVRRRDRFDHDVAIMPRAARESGFSLIELLVVVVILAILGAITVFAGINQKGEVAANKTNCSTLQTVEEAYYAAKEPHHYASDQATLKAAGFLHTTNDDFTITVDAGPPERVTITGPDCP
jgi:prepilin-type N-terminal cleavage/methylation domain-containing protein